MAVPVRPPLAQPGETRTIIAWTREIGDPVSAGETICEVETDKATVEIESQADGVLVAKLFDVGAEIPEDGPIAMVGDAAEVGTTEAGVAEGGAGAPGGATPSPAEPAAPPEPTAPEPAAAAAPAPQPAAPRRLAVSPAGAQAGRGAGGHAGRPDRHRARRPHHRTRRAGRPRVRPGPGSRRRAGSRRRCWRPSNPGARRPPPGRRAHARLAARHRAAHHDFLRRRHAAPATPCPPSRAPIRSSR